jgi:hypothetical protein
MDQENLYHQIQEILGSLQGNYNILEEQIDIDVQMEYFESSKNIRKTFNISKILENKNDLFSNDITIDDKKLLLSRLASIENVEAFRALEKYRNNPDPELKDWSTLAMQESKMLLESSFLDENQVFISTGLGGKGNKLRYFVVFIAKQDKVIDDFYRKIISSEMEFIFKNYDAEIEEFNFSEKYVTLRTIIPIDVSLNELFEYSVSECNQFGDFLEVNYIITNVKELSFSEIEQVLTTSKFNNDDNN